MRSIQTMRSIMQYTTGIPVIRPEFIQIAHSADEGKSNSKDILEHQNVRAFEVQAEHFQTERVQKRSLLSKQK